MAHDDLVGAVLVGGKSRRMGTNKAALTLEPDGPSLLEIVVERLRRVASEVVLVGGDRDDVAARGLPWIPDRVPGAGALGGIHAALVAAGGRPVVVVGCDMPFLCPELLRYMASRPRVFDALVPVADRFQPLHAIYTAPAVGSIEGHLRAGKYRVSAWLEQASIERIERPTIEQYDPSLLSLFNMNTPEDHAFAVREAARRRVGGALARHHAFPSGSGMPVAPKLDEPALAEST